MLPILNLNPNNETCIYSRILFVINQCIKMNIDDPSVTFWLKTLEIIADKRLRTVLTLGSFHMLISFYCSLEKSLSGIW